MAKLHLSQVCSVASGIVHISDDEPEFALLLKARLNGAEGSIEGNPKGIRERTSEGLLALGEGKGGGWILLCSFKIDWVAFVVTEDFPL
jgi:hypothetical protein